MKSLTGTFKLSLFILFLSGCFNSVSEYDAASYKSLTDLRSEMDASFDTYINSGAKGEEDLNTIKKFKTSISKDYEYAKEMEKNDDVIAQWEILNREVDEMMQTFVKNDSLTSGYCLEKWRKLEDAFDTAIKEKR